MVAVKTILLSKSLIRLFFFHLKLAHHGFGGLLNDHVVT